VIYGLVFIPARGRRGSAEDVRHFGTTDGHSLGLRLPLDYLRTPAAVDAFGIVVPYYLNWDDGRGLARKATSGLAKTPGSEAKQALKLLLDEPDENVRAFAAKRLTAGMSVTVYLDRGQLKVAGAESSRLRNRQSGPLIRLGLVREYRPESPAAPAAHPGP